MMLGALTWLGVTHESKVFADPPRPSGSSSASVSPSTSSSSSPVSSAAVADALQDLSAILEVLHSPRCQNCHPAADTPFVGDHGQLHRMNVSRKSPEAGLPCTSCHREQNAPFVHGPPGVHDWRMPPRAHPMPFEGMSDRALCEQLKDPSRNGGKSMHEMHEHFASDPLVGWGWNPGPGRSLPPISRPVLVTHVERWMAAGAPCP